MPGFFFKEPIVERICNTIDFTDDIKTYDADNLYPQRIHNIVQRSGTATICINKYSSFLSGEGFENISLNSLIINNEGLTLSESLDLISKDFALFNGFALHVNYNLNYKIASITPIPFKNCRLGIPDGYHNIDVIKYSPNWDWYNKYNSIYKEKVIIDFNRFNPDPEVIEREIEEAGGLSEYKGQILYFTGMDSNSYPLAIYDPVLDDMQVDAELKVFNLKNIKNGFMAGHLFKYPGSANSEEEQQKIYKELLKFTGPENANKLMIVSCPNPDQLSGNLIEKLDMSNNDKVYELTFNNAKNNIIESFGIPQILINSLQGGGLNFADQLPNAFKFYNSITRKKRDTISKIYDTIFANYKDEISDINKFSIKELVFESDIEIKENIIKRENEPINN